MMRRLKTGSRAGVVALGLAVLAAGCLYVPGTVEGEPGVGRNKLGVGLTGGWALASDKDLDSSSYWAGQVSYWFTGLVAARLWFGGATLEDTSGVSSGSLKVAPMAVSAMLSLPPSEDAKDGPFRWALGFGGGFLFFEHTGAGVSNPSPLPVLTLHGGGEWILAQGVGKLFLMSDVALGDSIKIAGEDRDLTSLITLRAGLEISF